MMRRFASLLAWLVFAVVPVSFCGGQTQPSTVPMVRLPSEIADALKHEASAFSPTITVAWTQDFQPPLTPEEYAGATGFKQFDHHRTFARVERLNLTWQSDGHYLLGFRQSFRPSGTDRTIVRFNIVHSFDGTIFYQHTTNPDEPHNVIRCDSDAKANAPDYMNTNYFDFIGFPLPIDVDRLSATHRCGRPSWNCSMPRIPT